MSRSTLIVLGGGEDQIPAYLEGRALGYRIVGVDQRPDALGAALADEFLCLTTREPEAIARRLGPLDVAAVISPASDAALASVAALSRHYGTAFQPAPRAVRASEDKGYFHTVVRRLGLPTHAYAQSGDADVLRDAAGRMQWPLVVKPTDSSGSKGLSHVTARADLRPAIAAARKHSFSGEVIIEEFLAGAHYSVECFAQAGRPAFTVVTERVLTEPPELISLSHVIPARLDPAVQGRLSDMLAAIFTELGHVNGPVNLDFVLHPSGAIHLIEMGARLGGNGMPLLVRHAFGVNTVAAAIRLATGQPVDLAGGPPPRVAMLRILGAAVDGTLSRVDGVREALALPGVVDLKLFKEPGERVRPYTQAAHKLGYLVAAADDRAALARTVETALATLTFTIEPDVANQEKHR